MSNILSAMPNVKNNYVLVVNIMLMVDWDTKTKTLFTQLLTSYGPKIIFILSNNFSTRTFAII